jgi:hypothetical protein
MKTFGDHLDQYRRYEEEIQEFANYTRNTHIIRELGSVDNNIIYLFESKTSDGTLISSGWQGDEPAGWEAAKILCKNFSNSSYIPYVSPACFKSRQHRNDYGKNVDREWPNPTTGEGKILKSCSEDLVRLSSKCWLSLQEDPKRFISYFYSWNVPIELEEAIEIGIKKHFPLTEGAKHSAKEGMFGGFIVESGSSMAIQLETPADGSYTISKRADCLVDVVSTIMKRL